MWIKSSYTNQLESELAVGKQQVQQAQDQAMSAAATTEALSSMAIENERRLKEELVKKDKLILEWMHTNAAFKKLTKDYAVQLGITEEQRIQNVDQARVDIAEEDPAFKHTELYKKSVDRVNNAKPKP